MKRRIFAILIALVVAVGVFPIRVFATDAHEHSYDTELEMLEGAQHSYICSCGQRIIEDCVFEYYTYNDTEHWTECVLCMNWIDRETHTVEDCVCTDENCGYTEHVVASWELSLEDSGMHVGYCSACRKNIVTYHDMEWRYSEDLHWTGCSCGYTDENEQGEHYMSDWYAQSMNRHFRYCGCGYMISDFHVDVDGDLICDIESCGGTVHPNMDGDHVCDDCGVMIDYLCMDENDDHLCDDEMCGNRMRWECVDENDDHICDALACGRYMQEVCEDEDGDYICDVCEQNCCYHYYLNSYISNGDGTHSTVCEDCGFLLVEDCDAWYDVFSCGAAGHGYVCYCDYELPLEAHTYEDGGFVGAYSVVGHWIGCDSCSYEYLEAHTGSNGVCEICEQVIVETFDVYVGGIGLASGQYLDIAGNVSSDKPAGGYAYYQNGVLELNGFTYEGSGLMWQAGDGYGYYASIFAVRDLILVLVGENQISSSVTEEDEEIYLCADGIALVGNLRVRGDGSLTVFATDDGFDVENGDFIMESGTLMLGEIEYNENDSVKGYVEIGDDGLDVDGGDVLIGGGILGIIADDHGIDAVGDVIITGGSINIVAGDDGIESDKAVTISGCKLNIKADDQLIIGNGVSVSTIEMSADEDETETPVTDDETQGVSGSNQTNGSANEANDIADKTSGVDGGLSTGVIASIAIGSVVAVELSAAAIFWFLIRKRSFADLICVFKKS